ncbi:MAG: hypothetical protein II902_02080 [Selenomonadaceae bacterium]|nr:hypothetical protein [Selenomonadaceae bacterium]
MAKEILKDEVLKEEQLEGVAGGTAREIGKDADFLKAIGLMRPEQNDQVTMKRAFAQSGISVIFHNGDDLANEYYLNGVQTTRENALKITMKKAGQEVDINNYL